jgi:hypothetical protein
MSYCADALDALNDDAARARLDGAVESGLYTDEPAGAEVILLDVNSDEPAPDGYVMVQDDNGNRGCINQRGRACGICEVISPSR